MMSPRDFARSLRKTPSRAERALWQLLRNGGAGAKFRRQHPIPPYVPDFIEAKLIVEVDGLSHDVSDQAAEDERRALFLEQAGWRVLRVRDVDVLADPQSVLAKIRQALGR